MQMKRVAFDHLQISAITATKTAKTRRQPRRQRGILERTITLARKTAGIPFFPCRPPDKPTLNLLRLRRNFVRCLDHFIHQLLEFRKTR